MADFIDQMIESDARGAQIIQFLAQRQDAYERAGFYPGNGSILDYNRTIDDLLRALRYKAKESATPRKEVRVGASYFSQILRRRQTKHLKGSFKNHHQALDNTPSAIPRS